MENLLCLVVGFQIRCRAAVSAKRPWQKSGDADRRGSEVAVSGAEEVGLAMLT